MDLDEDSIKFRAEGLGSQGRNAYSFQIQFYLPIEHKVRYDVLTWPAVNIAMNKNDI